MADGFSSTIRSICVYCSSSSDLSNVYLQTAECLGTLIAASGCSLVFGAGRIGLMGAVASTAHATGGEVIGVIPEFMKPYGVVSAQCTKLIWTADIRTRKATMEKLSDAFICLPGGFGTVEETMEILTLKQLAQHSKPVVILNTQHYYDDLLNLFETMYSQRFAKESYRRLYHVATTPEAAMDYLCKYENYSDMVEWI